MIINQNNCILTLSKPKWNKGNADYFNKYIRRVQNDQLYELLKNGELDDYMKDIKYVYLYHQHSFELTWYFINNRQKLNIKIIIHDPLHCGYDKKIRDEADLISCWSVDFVKKHIKDNHNKLFTMFLPTFEKNHEIKSFDERNSGDKYIVAGGNVLRDYMLLEQALRSLPVKCYILTDNKVRTNNPNIIIKNVSPVEFKDIVKGAMFGVIPIKKRRPLKFSQAHGCSVASIFINHRIPFIATENMGLNEYLNYGVFGETYKTFRVKERLTINSLHLKIKKFLREDVRKKYDEKIEKFFNENPSHMKDIQFVETLNEKFSLIDQKSNDESKIDQNK